MKSRTSGAGNVGELRLMSRLGRVRVGQCVSAVGATDVPAFFCLHSSCNHVSEVGGQ